MLELGCISFGAVLSLAAFGGSAVWRLKPNWGKGGTPQLRAIIGQELTTLFQSCRLALAFQINRSCDIITQLLECTIPHSVCHEKAKPFIYMLA